MEDAREAELELCDDYAAGRLEDREKAALEARLRESTYWRERVEFARALHLARQSPRSHGTKPNFSWLSVAAAATLVLCLWLGVDNYRLRQRVSSTPASVEPAKAPPGLSALTTLAVPVGVTRGADSVPVARLGNSQALRLDLDASRLPESRELVARLEKAGRTIQQGSLKRMPSAPGVALWIDASILEAGAYNVFVSDGDELVSAYRFRIER
jgi:hypothetical protein